MLILVTVAKFLSDTAFGLNLLVTSPGVAPGFCLMDPKISMMLGTLVQELSLAVYSAETSDQASVLLSSQLELLRSQQVTHEQIKQEQGKQEAAETSAQPAAKVRRLGAAGVVLLDAERGVGFELYENQAETQMGGLVKHVNKIKGLEVGVRPSLRDAPFEQVARWFRELDYNYHHVMTFLRTSDLPRIMQSVDDEDLPSVTVDALLVPTSPYQRAMVWANSTQRMARDEYAVGLQLAALRQVICSCDPNTAELVEFLVQARGYAVEPRADLDLEPPLWTAVRKRGFPGQAKVVLLLLAHRADPDRSFQGTDDALARSARELANQSITGIMDVLVHCEHMMEDCNWEV